MIYFPRKSSPLTVERFQSGGGLPLSYVTSQGRQTAWLLPARNGGIPEHLWIVCAGNASEALSLVELQQASGLVDDAFLLVDYPGYGVSEGVPDQASILENLRAAVPLAATATGFPLAEIGRRGVAFGHSLGCATALLGAEAFRVRRVVLLAPFTSTMEMTEVVVRVPLGWMVRHRFDNRARLAALKKRGGHVWIFHGKHDEIIPVAMGRTLARELGSAATYHEVQDGWHNDLLEKAGSEIFRAMRDGGN